MKKTNCTLTGYFKGISKKNKAYCIIYLLMPFDDAEVEKGARGQKAVQLFCPDDVISKVTDKLIDSVVEVTTVYAGNGNTILVDLNEVK